MNSNGQAFQANTALEIEITPTLAEIFPTWADDFKRKNFESVAGTCD